MTLGRFAPWLIWPATLVVLGSVIETNGLFEATRFAVHRDPALMPSTRAVAREHIVAGRPLLSVYTSEVDLYDPERGLLVHPTGRGRDWERFAYVSYFEEGALRFATGAGLRVHGGRSRVGSRHKSFGLFFRRRYGVPPDSRLFFDGPSGKLARLIVHNDIRHDRTGRAWHFVNPLAYEIAERIGAIVARTRPVSFFLNGNRQGAYVLTEHIGPEFLEARFGHSDFGIDDDGNRHLILRWARTLSPMTVEGVAREVDVDNLMNWALSILFCGTTDIWQGHLARDRRSEDGRWFWITWDLDHSFMDLYKRAPNTWEIDTYRSLLGEDSEARSYLLTRLIREDPAFRRQFAARLAEVLNHQLTPAYLSSRLNHYRLTAAMYDVENTQYLDLIEDFFEHRPAAIRSLTQRYLKLGPPSSVAVQIPAGRSIGIDGYPTPAPYTGMYFPETPVTLEVPPEHRDAFAGWLINGKAAGDESRLVVAPTSETTIVPRFRK